MKLKIKTKSGRICTLIVDFVTDEYFEGHDKYNSYTKINRKDIDTCFSIDAEEPI